MFPMTEMRKVSDKEEILLVGLEGESVTVFRTKQPHGTFSYGVSIDSGTLLDLLDEAEAAKLRQGQENETLYANLEDALNSLAPLFIHGSPIRVHAAYRSQIRAIRETYLRSISPSQVADSPGHRGKSWQRLLADNV